MPQGSPTTLDQAPETPPTPAWQMPWRTIGRWCVLLLGVIAGQVALYGPSLIGQTILLPLDLLTDPGIYLPRETGKDYPAPHDRVRSDLVYYYEPERRFAQSELAAGRMPLWDPHRFGGAPSYRWSFSPPMLPAYIVASPVVLAWVELLIALVAGTGAYVYFRRALGVSFWPAALVAWCYPLSGAMILWQGYGLPAVMCWLPWVLLATDAAVRRPTGMGSPSLALLTTIVLVGGAADIAGQLLLASGLYAIWCYLDQCGLSRPVRWRSIALPLLAWSLGIVMSLWLLAPMLEYVGTGARAAARSKGIEERPPVGMEALPQIVLPDFYGSTRSGSVRQVSGNVPESSAGAFAGLIAALAVGPLAWCSRRHRSRNILWTILILVSLSWSLDVPGMVNILRLPGMNLMSHNRFVFVTSFALLALAATGLDMLWNRQVSRHWWLLIPVALLLGLGSWCTYRAYVLPEPLATRTIEAPRDGKGAPGIEERLALETARRSFTRANSLGAGLCGIGLVVLLYVCIRGPLWRPAIVALAVAMLGEMLGFAHGRSVQCDPSLYYPRLDVLAQIKSGEPGRVIGFNCLPANLSQAAGLSDIRGYDGVDPSAMTELLKQTAMPGSTILPYALTQWLSPLVQVTPQGEVLLPPVLDMLGVRYVIVRGTPPPGFKADLSSLDYWVLMNRRALPRVYVPEHVKVAGDPAERLRLLTDPAFNPRRTAFVERELLLPVSCFGNANITRHTPTRVAIEADLETDALVVLADQWDPGWKARVDGLEQPVVRTNHAIRGVVTPAGRHQIVFQYQPQGLHTGLRWSALGLMACVAWLALGWWRGPGRAAVPQAKSRETGKASRAARRRKPPECVAHASNSKTPTSEAQG